MTTKKIPDLTELTSLAADDLLLVRDTSAIVDKKVQLSTMTAYMVIPAGSTTQVQYNNAGAFAGDAGLTYNATNDALTVAGRLVTPAIRPVSDSIAAIQMQTAGGTAVVAVDTTNRALFIDSVAPGSSYALTVKNTGANTGSVADFYHVGEMNHHKFARFRGANLDGSNEFSFAIGAYSTAAGYTQLEWDFTNIDAFIISGIADQVWNFATRIIFSNGLASNYHTDLPIVLNVNTSGSPKGIKFSTLGNELRLAIMENGNVAIGNNTSPTALLDIAASTTASASLRIRSGTFPTGANRKDGDIGYVTSGRLQMYRGSTEEIIPSAPAQSAYTQTYSTAARTVNAYTSDAESSAYTGIDNLQAGNVYAQVDELNALRTAYENMRASYDNLIQVVNALIDDGQAFGMT